MPSFCHFSLLEEYPQALTLKMTLYSWDEAKRERNLREHGFDFANAASVIDDISSHSHGEK